MNAPENNKKWLDEDDAPFEHMAYHERVQPSVRGQSACEQGALMRKEPRTNLLFDRLESLFAWSEKREGSIVIGAGLLLAAAAALLFAGALSFLPVLLLVVVGLVATGLIGGYWLGYHRGMRREQDGGRALEREKGEDDESEGRGKEHAPFLPEKSDGEWGCMKVSSDVQCGYPAELTWISPSGKLRRRWGNIWKRRTTGVAATTAVGLGLFGAGQSLLTVLCGSLLVACLWLLLRQDGVFTRQGWGRPKAKNPDGERFLEEKRHDQ